MICCIEKVHRYDNSAFQDGRMRQVLKFGLLSAMKESLRNLNDLSAIRADDQLTVDLKAALRKRIAELEYEDYPVSVH